MLAARLRGGQVAREDVEDDLGFELGRELTTFPHGSAPPTGPALSLGACPGFGAHYKHYLGWFNFSFYDQSDTVEKRTNFLFKGFAPPSQSMYVPAMPEKPSADPADHAEDFARRYALDLEAYCAIRMEELGIPEHLHGTRDFEGDGRWTAFIARDRQGGSLLEGIAVNSGCLNPELLKGKPGTRVFAKARLRDRVDAIIAHEYEEDRLGSHEAALKHGAKTALPITDGARRLLKAMGR